MHILSTNADIEPIVIEDASLLTYSAVAARKL